VNEAEEPDHLQLRNLIQQAKPITVGMFPDQLKKWVKEDPLAHEITAIFAKHPEYYNEFGAFARGIFPEPRKAMGGG
jgi:hypothetical protein